MADIDQLIASHPAVEAQLRTFLTSLQRRKVVGGLQCAKMTIDLMKVIMGNVKWSTAADLMRIVKHVGKALMEAQPLQLVIGNIVRRILFIIRQEHALKLREQRSMQMSSGDTTLSSSSFASSVDFSRADSGDDLSVPVLNLLTTIMEAVGELRNELEDIYDDICKLALEHIHANEVILTFSRSMTVEKFLKEAAEKKRVFEVIVAESAPSYAGQEMARSLAAAGIETTVIPDSAVYAIMARVNQVIMPCRAVIANGGLIAPCGGYMVALAAKELSVPVVCVTGLYKLSPVYRHDQDSFSDLKSASSLIEYDEISNLSDVDVVNPAFESIPPELVDLLITNTGGHQPSYVYRLLDEYYSHADRTLDE